MVFQLALIHSFTHSSNILTGSILCTEKREQNLEKSQLEPEMLFNTRCLLVYQSSQHLCITFWPHHSPFSPSFLLCVFVKVLLWCPVLCTSLPIARIAALSHYPELFFLLFNCHFLINLCLKGLEYILNILPQVHDRDLKCNQLITSNIVCGRLNGCVQSLFVIIVKSTEHLHCVFSLVLWFWPRVLKSWISTES